MIDEKTIATGAPSTCSICEYTRTLGVYSSLAGYYVGTWCECGPYSRESGYYRTRGGAQTALDTDTFER